MSEFSATVPDGPMTIEAQLEQLASLGFRLNPAASVDDLAAMDVRDELEAEPFNRLMFILGNEIEGGPHAGEPVCDQAWYVNFDCITGVGDYVKLAKRAARLFGTGFELGEVEDEIDWDAGKAGLRFRVGEDAYAADLAVVEGYMDPQAFHAVHAAAVRSGTDFGMLMIATNAPDMLFCTARTADLPRLRSLMELAGHQASEVHADLERFQPIA